MNNRKQLILILVCVAAAIAFLTYQLLQKAPGGRTPATGERFTEQSRLAEMSESGVRVTFYLETDSQGKPVLRATFTPDPGFHVYSKDLDPKTSGGVGVPTRLELLPNAAVKSDGRLQADVAPHIVRGTEPGEAVPAYPDGPVTLRLPIEITGAANSEIAAQAAVSYMACKTDGVCLRPVDRKTVDLRIPAELLRH